jgi:hypothetical protein
MKLFKRLLDTDICNFVTVYSSVPNGKATDPLKFRLLLTQSLTEKHKFAVLCAVYGCPSTELPPNRLTECHFLLQERITHRGDASYAQNTENKEKQLCAVNEEQVYVWMGISRGMTELSASNIVVFFTLYRMFS